MRRRVRAGSGATRPSELLARSEWPRAGYPGSQRATNRLVLLRVACARHGDAHAGDRCARCSTSTRSVRRRASASTSSPIRTPRAGSRRSPRCSRATRCSRSAPASARSRWRCSSAVRDVRAARARRLAWRASLRVGARRRRSASDADDRVDVRVGDACTVDLADSARAAAPAWTCVSNLPYNVAVPGGRAAARRGTRRRAHPGDGAA